MRKVRSKCMKVEMEKFGFKSVPFYENMTAGSRGKCKSCLPNFIQLNDREKKSIEV